MGKILDKKKQKMDKLLNTSFELFTSKGINQTSISDIVDRAGVAKGTFYLYFKDKYDIRNKLICRKSGQLFMNALEAMNAEKIGKIDDKIIYIVDHILNELAANTPLLNFIHKDLSWGVFKKALNSPYNSGDINIRDIYNEVLAESERKFKNPDLMLFTITELVGSTGYSAITFEDPVSLDKYKPFLYRTIRGIIDEYTITAKQQ